MLNQEFGLWATSCSNGSIYLKSWRIWRLWLSYRSNIDVHWVFGQVTEFLSSVFNFKEWTLFQTLNLFPAWLPGILFCKEKFWHWVPKWHQGQWCNRGNQRWSFGIYWFQQWIHTLLQSLPTLHRHSKPLIGYLCLLRGKITLKEW